MEKGTLVAADLSLSGKISKSADSIDKKRQRIDYNFSLRLANRKTGTGVWTGTEPIVKNASNKHIAF